jgi:hypothetical protein
MIEQFQSIDEACGVGSYKNIYFTAWWDEATIPRLEQLREHRKRFLAAQAGPLFSLSLLYQTKLKVVSKESRQLIEKISTEGSGRFVGEAYYVKTGGLLLSSMRFLLAGIRLISKSKGLEVFNDVDEAATWLSTQSKVEQKNIVLAAQSLTKLCGRQ